MFQKTGRLIAALPIFSLGLAAALGTAIGTINGLAEPEDFATLSFRRTQNCGNGNVVIEVESVNVAKILSGWSSVQRENS